MYNLLGDTISRGETGIYDGPPYYDGCAVTVFISRNRFGKELYKEFELQPFLGGQWG
jgi:hypothetical protein